MGPQSCESLVWHHRRLLRSDERHQRALLADPVGDPGPRPGLLEHPRGLLAEAREGDEHGHATRVVEVFERAFEEPSEGVDAVVTELKAGFHSGRRTASLRTSVIRDALW